MTPEELETVRFLSERYAGPVAARALWLWAGGRAEEIEYRRSPEEQWTLLWERAGEGDGSMRGRLITEVRRDHPDAPGAGA